MRAIGLDNDPGLRFDLQRIINSVEKPAQGDSSRQFDDFPVVKVASKRVKYDVPNTPWTLGDEHGVVAHQALARIETRDVGLEDPVDRLRWESHALQDWPVVVHAVLAAIRRAGRHDGDLDELLW